MSTELELAARAVQELQPAVQEFVEATGVVEPIRQLSLWLADIVKYRRAPHQARLLMRAAEKIRATGLPARAVSDRLLRAVLEDGSFEDDPGMQERWANLLAQEATLKPVPPSFPEILRQLEPIEARFLDAVADHFRHIQAAVPRFQMAGREEWAELQWRHLDNLERLQLISYRNPPTAGSALLAATRTIDVRTEVDMKMLGVAFIEACQAPGPQ